MTFFSDSSRPFYLRPPQWSLAMERQFQEWTRERELPLARRVYPFLILLVLAFGAWDYWLDASAISVTWPLRVVASLALAIVFFGLQSRRLAALWREITFAVNLLLFTLLLLILVQIENGPVWGMAGLLLSAILFRVHSPILAICSALAGLALVLVIYNFYGVPGKVVLDTQLFLACAWAGNALLNYTDNQRDRELFALSRQLETLAMTDGLTGAANRRTFSERLGLEIDRAARYDEPLSLVLLDIDFFKKVNDMRGHGDGDIALQTIAQIGLKYRRGTDLFARLGGEEFVILMPHTDSQAALAVAERLREEIEAYPIPGETGNFSVTASFGVALFDRQECDSAFLARADTALYRAKASGRNRVEFAEARSLQTV